jgi:hypothetical protein
LYSALQAVEPKREDSTVFADPQCGQATVSAVAGLAMKRTTLLPAGVWCGGAMP